MVAMRDTYLSNRPLNWDTKFAEGADELQPGDGLDVVQPVTGVGVAGGHDDLGVGVEPDGTDAQAGAACHIPDRVELVVVHGVHYGVSSRLRLNPFR